jgi:L-amino acid N-acyltransferase YncA
MAALTDERYRENRVAVAERDGELIGIAMSGPPLDAGAAWARQLYVLYVYAADHGTGAGPALLEAVVDPEQPVALWVPTRTLVPRRSTASTASLPTGRPRSRAGCGRSAWSGAGSTAGNPVRGRAPGWRHRPDAPQRRAARLAA